MFRTDEKVTWLAPDGVPGAAAASPAAATGEPSDAAPEVEETEEIVEEVEEEVSETPPGVGPKKGPPPGHPRWERVYAGFKQAEKYSQFGSPEQVEASLRRLQRYDEQIEAADRKGKGDTEETQEMREARDRVEAQLKKMFPWFERAAEVQHDYDLRRESLRMRAGEQTVALMDELGWEHSQENYNRLSGVLQEIIASDKRLYTLYTTDPERAVKEALKAYQEPFKVQATRKQNADLIRSKKPHEALPKPAPKSSGGPSSAPAPKEPQSIKEAEALFTQRLKQVNRG